MVPTIYAPGNHDFYSDADSEEGTRTIDELSDMARELADCLGIALLLDDTVVVGDTRFIGGTLWTDFYVGAGTLQHHIGEARGPRGMTDYKSIRRWSTAQPGKRKRARPEDTIALHKRTRRYIENVIDVPFDGETVVVTHHSPHPQSLDPRHAGRLDWCYASDLSSIMTGPDAPEFWLHGHIHRSVDYVVGGTRVLSNPRGYAFDDDERARAGFRPDFVVEIGDPVPRPPGP